MEFQAHIGAHTNTITITTSLKERNSLKFFNIPIYFVKLRRSISDVKHFRKIKNFGADTHGPSQMEYMIINKNLI